MVSEAKARLLSNGYYEVTVGPKWYTAQKLTSGQFYITNHLGRGIRLGSAIHRRVTAAINRLAAGDDS